MKIHKRIILRGLLIFISCFALFSMILGCSEKPTPTPWASFYITSEKFVDYTWPFTVKDGWIECWGKSTVIFRISDGREFAVSYWEASRLGRTSIKEADILTDEGREWHGPFLTRALEFCSLGKSPYEH